MVKDLPLVVQALLYRVVALIIALLLYRELRKLFEMSCHEIEACLLALGVILAEYSIDRYWLGNVSWSILVGVSRHAFMSCGSMRQVRNTRLAALREF